MNSYVRNFEYELHHHLNVLFPNKPSQELEQPAPDMIEEWVDNYQNTLSYDKRDKYIPKASYKTSLTNADATALKSFSPHTLC